MSTRGNVSRRSLEPTPRPRVAFMSGSVYQGQDGKIVAVVVLAVCVVVVVVVVASYKCLKKEHPDRDRPS